jgi:hypothetical protein
MRRHTQNFQQFRPVSVAEGFGLELRNDCVGLKVCFDDLLHKFEGSILAHATWKVPRRSKNAVELVAHFPRLKATCEILAAQTVKPYLNGDPTDFLKVT